MRLTLYISPTDDKVDVDWFPDSLKSLPESTTIRTKLDPRIAPGRPLMVVSE